MRCVYLVSVWRNANAAAKVALHNSIAHNAASLLLIQTANLLLPLITVPYLLRTLGPAGFGLVAFGQSLVAIFGVFVDYGFSWSATRRISVERDNRLALQRTAYSVWIAKALICALSFLVLLTIVAAVPKLREISVLLFVLYGTVIGKVLFPAWLFQGMEQMVQIAVINLVVQLCVTLGVFAVIHSPEDYLIYSGLISLGSISAGLIGAFVALVTFRLRPYVPSWQMIWDRLVEGWMIFLSMASISLFTAANAFILGLLTTPAVVGYYSAAEKIVQTAWGFLATITLAAFPRFSKLASHSRSLTLLWGRRMMGIMGSLGALMTAAMFLSAPIVVRLVLGLEFEPSVAVIQILSPLIFINAITNVWGLQIMIPFGYDKPFFVILLLAGLLNVGLAFALAPTWNERGMAVAVVLAATSVAISQPLFLFSHGINILQRRVSS